MDSHRPRIRTHVTHFIRFYVSNISCTPYNHGPRFAIKRGAIYFTALLSAFLHIDIKCVLRLSSYDFLSFDFLYIAFYFLSCIYNSLYSVFSLSVLFLMSL